MRGTHGTNLLCKLMVLAVSLAIPSTTRMFAQALPAGFQEAIVFSGLTEPTMARFSPDGRVFIAEKSGLIKVFASISANTPTVVADLRTNVYNYEDRGLLGLAIDPGFPNRPYIYLLYTYDAPIGGTAPVWGSPGISSDPCPDPPGANTNGCVVSARLSRLQISGDVALGPEQVLINDWCEQFPSHSIGTVTFGADGALYIGAGDGASYDVVDYGQYGSPLNPCADPPAGLGGNENPPTAKGGALRAQSLRRAAGEPVSLDGSIIRVNPDTGDAMPDNPLSTSNNANARRIVAYGLRNPFRFALRPDTNELWIGDVGWNSWEEINVVANPLATPVKNFGWPCYEGGGRQGSYDSANLDICETLYGQSGAVTPPFFTYSHSSTLVSGDSCPTGSSSISGMAFYNGGSYPASYNGALFFADYSRNCIWIMMPGSNGLPSTSNLKTFGGASTPVDLEIGPGGDIFYVDIGGGTIRRVSYTGGPTAVASATPTSGPPPLAVQFDGSGSTTSRPGDTLTYAWDLQGNGLYTDSTQVQPTYTYQQSGKYSARLKVTDNHGASSNSIPVTISVGGPAVTITQPSSGTTWRVGDLIQFAGSATDAVDGPLPANALSWSVVIYHCPSNCHTHFLQSWTGVSSGSFSAPDHEYPSYLLLTLTATNSKNVQGSTSVRLDPQTVTLDFQSQPVGMTLSVNSTTGTTPFSKTVIIGSNNSISAPNQAAQGSVYNFASWSDGGGQTHNIVAPANAATYTANFTSTAGNGVLIDAVAPHDNVSSISSVTSSALSTAFSNELLLAFISTDSQATGGVTVTSVTGASLTWVLVKRANSQPGDAEIWRAFAPSVLNNVTVTANLSQSTMASITVVTFIGADASGTNGSGAIGATVAAGAASGAPTASLLTTRNNSWVFGVGVDWDHAIARTLGANQAMVHEYLTPVSSDYWVQRQNSATPVSGTTVTVNDIAPTTDKYNLALVEILPALPSGPDFGFTAAPSSQTVPVDSSTTYTVTLASQNGFSGTVNLGVNGLPAGASGSFNPTTLTSSGSSTLTISTAASTPPGSYSLTVTGTSGSLSHSASVTFVVTGPPDFTVSASPASQTVVVGSSTTYSATIAGQNGFSGTVSLNVSDLPVGASGSFNPGTITGSGSSTLTISTGNATPLGTYSLTITASSGTLTHSSGTSLSVTASPPAGQLAIDAFPSGDGTASNTSITTPPFSTAVPNELLLACVSTDSSSSGGMTVTSVSGAGLAWAPVKRANAQPGDAEIWRAYATSKLSNVTVTANLSQSTVASITVIAFTGVDSSGTNGSGAIGATAAFSAATGAPSGSLVTTRNNAWIVGVGADWDHAIARTWPSNQAMVHQYLTPINSTLWVQRQNTATPLSGTVVTINDTAPTTDKYNLALVEILPALSASPDFAVAISPASQTVQIGASTTYTASVTSQNGFSGTVNLSVSGLPQGAIGTFDANTVSGSGSATLTVNTDSSITPGPYPFSITGTSGSLTHSANATLVVAAPPDFTISASPGSQTVVVGSSLSYTATIASQNGFSGTVTLAASGLPTGVTASFNPATISGGGSSTLTLVTTNSTPLGTYTVAISGTSGNLTHNTNVTMVVAAAPPPGLAIDAVIPMNGTSSSTAIASPSFSTSASNKLFLAFISTDSSRSGGMTVTGVSGAGLTWVPVKRANATLGDAEIWRAFATSALNNVRVTANLSQSTVASLTVVIFSGADPSGTNGSGAIGATAAVSAASGAPIATVTTTRNNSWVFGVGADWDRAILRTMGPNQMMVQQYLTPVNSTFWVQRQTNTTLQSGTTVTINDTAPANDKYNLSLVEILPAP